MPLVKAIRQQMNQTGAAVAGAGFSSLGELVVFILEVPEFIRALSAGGFVPMAAANSGMQG